MPAPPSTDAVRDRLAALLPELRERHAVRSLSIFGSYARGEQTAESDLDVLVEFDRVPGMIGFVGLAHLLEDRLGLSVDLFTRPMLKPRIAPGVEADLEVVPSSPEPCHCERSDAISRPGAPCFEIAASLRSSQ